MRIGIIGAGQIGGTLAHDLANLGHKVSIANSRGPETLRDLASQICATAASVVDLVKEKDMVIVAIPTTSMPKLPKGLFAHLPEEVPIVDTSNYYPELRDGRIPIIDEGMLDSEWVSQQLGRSVIKAFNNILATSLIGPRMGKDGKIALPVAGNNLTAKTKVLGLIAELGFDALDAGDLANSWRQQMGSPAYCNDLNLKGLKIALERADRSKSSEYRVAEEERVRKIMESRK